MELYFIIVVFFWCMLHVLTARMRDVRVQCGCGRVLFCAGISVAAFVLRLGTVSHHSHVVAELGAR